MVTLILKDTYMELQEEIKESQSHISRLMEKIEDKDNVSNNV